ncbi:hypothetical protein C8R46DRAFT_1208425 [Mycena filopes]|nr:hypothetical protein C8R46DRAFT_1208425 [Mycena filopes]
MARSSSTQPVNRTESSNSATCDQCGASMKRVADLPRHMLLHAKNKEEFMFTCPVAGCTHQTLQRSNLDTHIRTHTRAKPHKCPEYLPNGQKCIFATADPSSLHRHRKRKHGYQPRPTARSGAPVASGSGSREKSVESDGSFESEESFGLRPESEADPPVSYDTMAYSVHVPYLGPPDLKASEFHYTSKYYRPLDLKVPDWIRSPAQLPTTVQPDSGYGNTAIPQFEFATQWPKSVSPKFDDFGALYFPYDPTFQADPYSWASYSSCGTVFPSPFQQEFATCSMEHPETSEFNPKPADYLPLPYDLFPRRVFWYH